MCLNIWSLIGGTVWGDFINFAMRGKEKPVEVKEEKDCLKGKETESG